MRRRASRVCLVAFVLLAAAGCRSSGAGTTPPPDPAGGADGGELGIGDVFVVRVYGEDDLSDEYRVATDGSIDFPLLGRVAVDGLDSTELAELLEQRLRTGGILVSPHVSVLVREVNSKRVTVVGAVARPGTFPFGSDMSVVQAITIAGGFTPLASRNDTVVTRRIEGELQRYRVRVDDVARGRRPDFPLRSGDIVFVPQRAF